MEAAAAGAAAPAAGAVAAAPAGAAAEAVEGPAAAAAAGLLETVVGAGACRRLDPWAAFLHARLAAVSPLLGDMLDARLLLVVLAAAALLGVLRLVIDMLLFIQNASAQPKDTIGLLTHYVFKVGLHSTVCAPPASVPACPPARRPAA
jgi:hypothetical protein